MTEHTESTRPGHPVEAFLCSTLDALKGLADVPVWSMDDATTDRVVVLAAKVAAGVAEVEARAVGHAETLGRPGAVGCGSVKAWLQMTTRVTGRTATAKARLARLLGKHEPTRVAVARGEVHAEQAEAIVKVIEDLGPEVSDHDKGRAETLLLDEASDHDADQLAELGREIGVRLDPEGAEAREAAALEAQEKRAKAKTRFSMWDDGEGMCHGRFDIPSLEGDMLRKALQALAAPKSVNGTHGAGSYDWETPTPKKLGEAFCTYIRRYPVDRLPKVGGLAATVVVVGDFDVLEGKARAAWLDTGTRISPTEYLRMACEAGIIPMWMNATGEVLASGRRHRFHTPAQRLAAIVQQRHCQHPGCDVPGHLCHLHHDNPWAEGGDTSLRNARLLCPFHHGLAHGGHPMRT